LTVSGPCEIPARLCCRQVKLGEEGEARVVEGLRKYAQEDPEARRCYQFYESQVEPVYSFLGLK